MVQGPGIMMDAKETPIRALGWLFWQCLLYDAVVYCRDAKLFDLDDWVISVKWPCLNVAVGLCKGSYRRFYSFPAFCNGINLPNPTICKSLCFLDDDTASLEVLLFSETNSLFPLFHINVQPPFFIVCGYAIEKSLFVSNSSSVTCKQIGGNGEALMFVLFRQIGWHPSS